MAATPLDNPIWAALDGPQRELAEGGADARRFPPSMAPFAGLRAPAASAFAALHGLLQPGEAAALFSAEKLAPPPLILEVVRETALSQMVLTGPPPAQAGDVAQLTAADAPAMQRLAALARPGPFGPRTHELGGFVGIRHKGELIAMAGERFRLPGFTEVSAVATHPDHRGRGLGRIVTAAALDRIAARGDTPFLHVFADNAAAIALYRALGMQVRCPMHLMVLRRPEA